MPLMELEQRKQITLFVPEPFRSQIDPIRQRFNLVQYSLIAAHVSLCREDEVNDWATIQATARQITSINISLSFGTPTRENNLVYLPVVGSTNDFDELRRRILDDANCRKQQPHITLIHPRNGTCSIQQFELICELAKEWTITFHNLTFIKKIGDSPWRNLCTFPPENSTRAF